MGKKITDFKTTKEIDVSKKIIEQVIGQDEAVDIMKKAARQRRHVLLIGEPGTGKSLLGIGLAEMLPKSELKDILCFPNPNDENQPLIRQVEAGEGRKLAMAARMKMTGFFNSKNMFLLILVIIAMIAPWYAYQKYQSDVIFAAFFIGGMIFVAAFVIFLSLGRRMQMSSSEGVPKVIVDNYGKNNALFFDATGAHAGALLGDVLHDPLQSLRGSDTLAVAGNEVIKEVASNELIDNFFLTNKNVLKKKENNYEAIHLRKDELFVLGETQGSVCPVEVLSCNRYDYCGSMIKLTTSENKELIVTPEHKIAISKNGKIEYVEARNIKKGDEVVAQADNIIIDEQDIINTYDKRQQFLAKSYYDYLELRKQNPSWGHKKLATRLGVSNRRTRWWWENNSAPAPVQTVNWLKKRGLIPLKTNNQKLPLIAKVIGATFGDGGIFENLNGIFLCSSNFHDTDEFSKDLQKIFGNDTLLNSEVREGGEYGHSWCTMNTNRNVIRFSLALGAAHGNKINKTLRIPNWIKLKEDLKDEFYGSLFGGELGVSYKAKAKIPRIEFSISGLKHLKENRIQFLQEMIDYLKSKDISVTKKSIDIYPLKSQRGSKDKNIYRILLSQSLPNIQCFIDGVKINYCNLKKHKLFVAMSKNKEDKLIKYLQMRAKGLGAESIMKKLEIDHKYLYKILNTIKIEQNDLEATA